MIMTSEILLSPSGRSAWMSERVGDGYIGLVCNNSVSERTEIATDCVGQLTPTRRIQPRRFRVAATTMAISASAMAIAIMSQASLIALTNPARSTSGRASS